MIVARIPPLTLTVSDQLHSNASDAALMPIVTSTENASAIRTGADQTAPAMSESAGSPVWAAMDHPPLTARTVSPMPQILAVPAPAMKTGAILTVVVGQESVALHVTAVMVMVQ